MRRVEEHSTYLAQGHNKLPLLLRSAERVAAFSPECEKCRVLQVQIAGLGAELDNSRRMTRQNLKGHLKVIKGVTKHLRRTHGLAEERHYIKRFATTSVTVGLSFVALSLVLLSLGVTLLALNLTLIALVPRIAFGCTIGYLLDRRARRMGKVM